MGMQIPAIAALPASNFNSIFKKLAESHAMAFVPFYLEGVAGKAHLNIRDGVHPSAAGYKVIAEKIWPVIKPLL